MSMLSMLLQPLTHLSLPTPTPTTSPFTTHTILITGSNTGIGLASATHFASLGASRIILAVRSVSSGLKAKRTIEDAIASRLGENTTANTNTNTTSTVIEVWQLDLSSFDSIKDFAERANKLDRLHVAVMNAGKASTTWSQTHDGWEDMLQVNVLGTALLSLLLLPLLVRTAELDNTTMTAGQQQQQQAQPHLIIVGSGSHGDARLTHELSAPRILETLNDRAHCEEWKTSPVERYANTKLFGLYIAESLAALPYLFSSSPSSSSLSSSSAATAAATGRPKVIVSCVTPGFCKSELLSREPGVPWVLLLVQKLVGRSVLEGAKCVVDAAARGSESHGKYLDNQRLTTPVGLAVGEEGARVRGRVWAELVDVLQRVAPEIMQVVG